jgi:hypothetical protein
MKTYTLAKLVHRKEFLNSFKYEPGTEVKIVSHVRQTLEDGTPLKAPVLAQFPDGRKWWVTEEDVGIE